MVSIKIGMGLSTANVGASDPFAAYQAGGEYPSALIDREAGFYAIGDGGATAPTEVTQAEMFVAGSTGLLTAAANAKAAAARSAIVVATPPSTIASEWLLAVSDGGFSQVWNCRIFSGTGNINFITVDGSQQANLVAGSATASTRFSAGGSTNTNAFLTSFNGASGASDSVGTLPTVDEIDVGQTPVGGSPFTGTIHKILIYPKVLDQSELNAATTSIT